MTGPRGRAPTTALAIGLSAVTGVLFALMPLLNRMAQAPQAEDDGAAGLVWVAAWLGFPVVGALLAARRPRHPIGWILIAITLTLAIAVTSETVAVSHAIGPPLPLGDVATWLSFLSAAPPFMLIPFLILLFPTGTIGSRVWRRLAIAAMAVAAAEILALSVRPAENLQGVRLVNPLGIESLGPAIDLAIPVLGITFGIFAFATIGDAIARFRRSKGIERLQFAWFARAALLFPVGMGASLALDPVLSPWAQDAVVAGTFFVSFNGMAVAIGVAVTRHHLYDIDRVVSRTITYTLLTGALAGVYAAGVLGVGAVVPGERSDVVVAASTLAMAGLFRPARSRIQATVDRRFHRARYDAGRTIEAFGRSLRDELDLDSLSTALRAAAAEAVQPQAAALWLKEATA